MVVSSVRNDVVCSDASSTSASWARVYAVRHMPPSVRYCSKRGAPRRATATLRAWCRPCSPFGRHDAFEDGAELHREQRVAAVGAGEARLHHAQRRHNVQLLPLPRNAAATPEQPLLREKLKTTRDRCTQRRATSVQVVGI
jgi:hypothetical protein